ncbi:GNAT family N-acetyltransferase [Hydrogenovibrio kuenenii]|uniref:GNAT family N-acetyltransferase n=1 Tax=Hydrogenovibrio kuenenii TaxID=63658 RepID=UPI000465019F|nr:GNAT family N-acetyltransferase [Hydrogenovibrio kuenenii]
MPDTQAHSTPKPQDWQSWCRLLHNYLAEQKHRACVVLVGENTWRQNHIQQALIELATTKPTLTGLEITQEIASSFNATQAVSAKKLPHYLGQETDFAIFSGEQGLDANALGQAGGMIRAGGILWLSLPVNWMEFPNPSNSRFLSYPLTLENSLKGFNRFLWQGLQTQAKQQQVLWITQNSPLPALPTSAISETPAFDTNKPALHLNADQQAAWEKIQSVAFGHRHRPLVLTADRGRGKSTLLGVAAIRLLQQGKQTIAVTAARLDQTQALFQGATQTLNQLIEEYSDSIQIIENLPGRVRFNIQVQQGNKEITERKELLFIAPDELVLNAHKACDLLMVDEAAHLPLPLLLSLSETYNRMIFATTQQGYEGSGRGFTLKFQATLKQQFPQTKTATLQTPIRWADGDPLENTLNQCLLFSTDTGEASPPVSTTDISKLTYRPISVDDLLSDRNQLVQLFQLLTYAHYQTAPNDLMQLLETPNQQLWVAEHDQQIFGVLFALEEGNLPIETEGRKQGHLFPQQMHLQTGNSEWLLPRTLRIVRLAVQPEMQSQGIGSELLQSVIFDAEKAGFSAVTTSFGATPSLADFWHQNGFTALHLGIKRDKASGTHSLMMAQPFDLNLRELVAQQHRNFHHQFSWLLTDAFQHLSAELILAILSGNQITLKTDFPMGYLENQPFEAVSWQLRQWTLNQPETIKKIDEPLRTNWIQRVLQNHAWEALIKAGETTSRKQLEQQFKTLFDRLTKL